MIGRKHVRVENENEVRPNPRGFDDFELRLGDVMRGERATMGKSLLDVQRELRIKASYIAAIENCDPSAFDTPGFIAGYVRSYARYLNMNPDEAYDAFCQESGFEVAHGMSSEASVVKRSDDRAAYTRRTHTYDPFGSGLSRLNTTTGESVLAQIEPRAIGSMMVLVALMGGLGFGAWTVLREVQQVQVVPVDQAPVVLSDLDPINADTSVSGETEQAFSAPSVEALDRLYRPQALDVPVLVARDAPIATLDPRSGGAFRAPDVPDAPALGDPASDLVQAAPVPQVVEETGPQLRMVAVRPAWVRVTSADGSVVFEGIMEGGQTYDVPATEDPATLRVGESGSIYFDVAGDLYGPIGDRGTVTSNFSLAAENVSQSMTLADLDVDSDLAQMVAEAALDANSDD